MNTNVPFLLLAAVLWPLVGACAAYALYETYRHIRPARLAEHGQAETGVDSHTRPQHGKEDATP